MPFYIYEMEISGTVIQVLPEESGQSARGTWRKQSYVLETEGQYPKKVCLQVWGDKIDTFNIQENSKITASIEVESREFNGRWYTDVKAWKVNQTQSASNEKANDVPLPTEPPLVEGDDEDMPF